MTKNKKVNEKDLKKSELAKMIGEMLVAQNIESFNGTDFGFTANSILVRFAETDIQIKLIAPKAGVIRYEELE